MSTTAAEPTARSLKPSIVSGPGAWATAALGLLAVGATAALLHWNAIVAAAATWWTSPTYGYGILVPLVVAWLLWRQRGALRQTAPRPWPLGLVLVGGAALAATVGQVVSALAIEQLALVALLQAAALTIVGPTAFRLLAFALFYLYLAVPVGDGLIAPLQELTAGFAVGALELVGVPAQLNGLLIQIPSATFHVAEACAGLRFLLASLAVGLLLAYLFFRSWWARLLFTTLSIVLPIVGNALRAAGVVLIAHVSDTHLALGFDHLTYGYVFTALLLVCMVALAALLGSPRRTAPPFRPPVARTAAPGWTLAIAGGAVLVTALPALAARPGAAPCPTAPVLEPPRIAAPWRRVERGRRLETRRRQSGRRAVAGLPRQQRHGRSLRRLLLCAAPGRRNREPGASPERRGALAGPGAGTRPAACRQERAPGARSPRCGLPGSAGWS